MLVAAVRKQGSTMQNSAEDTPLLCFGGVEGELSTVLQLFFVLFVGGRAVHPSVGEGTSLTALML